MFDFHSGGKRTPALRHQLSDTHSEYSGCLPVLNCLLADAAEQGTLEEGTGTTNKATLMEKSDEETPLDHDKSHERIDTTNM